METIWAGAYVRTHEVKLQDKGQQETLGAETRSINEHLAGRERFTHPGVRLTNPEPATAPFPDRPTLSRSQRAAEHVQTDVPAAWCVELIFQTYKLGRNYTAGAADSCDEW